MSRTSQASDPAATALGILDRMPSPVAKQVCILLDTKDHVACRLLCRRSEVWLGQAITHLHLGGLNLDWGDVDERPFRMFTQLESVTIQILEGYDSCAAGFVRLLELVMNQPTLKRLQVTVVGGEHSVAPAVLAELPGCRGLEVLDLYLSSETTPQELGLPNMATAVGLCSFPHVKELNLGGWALWGTGAAWLGLLSMWDQGPEDFRQLRDVRLRFPTQADAHALAQMGSRLAALPDKHLRSLFVFIPTHEAKDELFQAILGLVAGACTHCSQTVELTVVGISGGQLGGLLAIAIPSQGVALTGLSVQGLPNAFALAQAMTSGQLASLQQLTVAVRNEDVESVLGVLECLSGTPLVCPELADLQLTVERATTVLLGALRTATGAHGRKLKRIVLDCPLVSDKVAEAFCTHDLRYPSLTHLDMARTSPRGIEKFIEMLQTACDKPSKVRLKAECVSCRTSY